VVYEVSIRLLYIEMAGGGRAETSFDHQRGSIGVLHVAGSGGPVLQATCGLLRLSNFAVMILGAVLCFF
jgi:hypothetical protein